MSSQPEYPHTGIASIDSFAKALKLNTSELQHIADSASSLYRIAKVIEKEDSTQRVTYDALKPLKVVLSTLRKRIIDKAYLPDYIAAGKKGKSYINNAQLHAGSKGLLSEDIKNFFPQISSNSVFQAFKYLYKMSPEVAEIATLLCTKDGYLVQGSPVSGSLANVIFFAAEPSLVDELKQLGFRYTRYYDDVHISHETDDFSHNIGKLRTKVYGVFLSQGLQPHRTVKKSHYANSSRRMTVHGIIINNEKIKPNPKKVADTRAMLFQMERLLETDYTIDTVVSLYMSIRGKIQTLKAQGGAKSETQMKKLNNLMQKVDENKAKKFARKIRKVKTSKEYNRLSSKLSILKKINIKVMRVVKIENGMAKKRLNMKQAA
jgi:hypothetical protein